MMILNNLYYRAGDWLGRNRKKVIKWAIVVVAALFFAWLIYYIAGQIESARSARKINALEALERDATARAKTLEAEAAVLKSAKETLEVERRNLEHRAMRAEAVLVSARRAVEPLRKTYEETRDNPDVPADTTCADACAELADLHPCR